MLDLSLQVKVVITQEQKWFSTIKTDRSGPWPQNCSQITALKKEILEHYVNLVAL